MLHNISIKERWRNAIYQGEKTFEGRLNKGRFGKLRKNDIVKWYVVGKKMAVFTKIIGIHKYKSFEAMLQKETLRKTLPGIDTIEDGINVYRQFYTQRDERKFGVLAIELKTIKNHNMSFRDPPECPLLDAIINGQKTVEGRVNGRGSREMSEGDIITLKTPNRSVVCLITYVKLYDTLRHYLEAETVAKTIPCVSTIEEAIKVYNSFYKTKEIAEQKRQEARRYYGYGFVAIGIKYIGN